MNSADVRAALRTRWPDADYLVIDEAPDGPGRQGRKLDLVAIALWRSRGYTVDGVEIKVSMGDLRRELKEPAKADWWWHHCDRFWIAVPSDLAKKAKDEIPATWGVLACSEDGKSRVARQAPIRPDRKPFTWPETIGLLRAAADAGIGALDRAERRGVTRGIEIGRAEPRATDTDERCHAELVRLEGLLAEVAVNAGVKQIRAKNEARMVGQDALVGRNLASGFSPVSEQARRSLDAAERVTEEIRKLVGKLTEAAPETPPDP